MEARHFLEKAEDTTKLLGEYWSSGQAIIRVGYVFANIALAFVRAYMERTEAYEERTRRMPY